MRKENIQRLKEYPLSEGAAHKQFALNYAGLLQALRHGSEGGIDVSNVPYAYASLPLDDAEDVARRILEAVEHETRKHVAVMVVDSDKTYSFRRLHVTPRTRPLKGITDLGLLAYIVGRMLRWRARSTPLALVGATFSVEEALQIAAVANKVRGYGAGRTAWDMAERFNVKFTDVTWEMLKAMEHYPLVIVRKKRG